MKTIFVNGTFDILHLGHLALLNYAKTLGSSLTVAIDSDQRVKQLKGANRPINSQVDRATMLVNLKAVDSVFIFDTDEELVDLIKKHDIMVKGSDYKDTVIIGAEHIPMLLFFDRVQGLSTTQAIQHIITKTT